ncbi:MAG: ATP-binding protein [Methanosarcina sp.]
MKTNPEIIKQNNTDIDLPLNLLIVEDNPGDIIIFREILRASGIKFNLTNASSLKDSIAFLNENTYDVIFLDLGLPDSNGTETLSEFLTHDYSAPVIVMTGLDDEVTALSSLREGAQDYLVKNHLDPFNITKSIKYSIERKKLENLRKKNSQRLSILSSTTKALHEGDDISSVYSLISNSVRQLVSNAFIFSVQIGEENESIIYDYDQLLPYEDKLREFFDFDRYISGFTLNESQYDIIKRCNDGKIHQIEGGLHKLLGGVVPSENCRRLERILGVKHAYITGFLKNDFLFGGILIISASDLEEDDEKIIENICSQASLSIYRRIMKKNLLVSEAKYQKLAEELEEKVSERTRELEAANAQLRISENQLRELNATKDKFFNIVAHDLKNPFTSLLGATEVLTHNIETMEKEKIRKLAQILNDSSKSGYAILLNLLDWSRSQTGLIKINPQVLNLKKVLDDNIMDLHLSSHDKEITIKSEMPDELRIVVDKNMLNTILRNLLSNAIKFTPRGGMVNISCTIIDQIITLCVKDTGIGIPAEYIDKLFRIDSKYSRPGTEKEVGTGLGLKLCREFVEKLGGKIWVISEENIGSEFCFSLPVRE